MEKRPVTSSIHLLLKVSPKLFRSFCKLAYGCTVLYFCACHFIVLNLLSSIFLHTRVSLRDIAYITIVLYFLLI
jgi:hypothetical protein